MFLPLTRDQRHLASNPSSVQVVFHPLPKTLQIISVASNYESRLAWLKISYLFKTRILLDDSWHHDSKLPGSHAAPGYGSGPSVAFGGKEIAQLISFWRYYLTRPPHHSWRLRRSMSKIRNPNKQGDGKPHRFIAASFHSCYCCAWSLLGCWGEASICSWSARISSCSWPLMV
jgi:hypothetical protein